MPDSDYWMSIYKIIFDGQPLSGHPCTLVHFCPVANQTNIITVHEDFRMLALRFDEIILTSAITRNLTRNLRTLFTGRGQEGLTSTFHNEVLLTLPDSVEKAVREAFASTAEMVVATSDQQGVETLPLLEINPFSSPFDDEVLFQTADASNASCLSPVDPASLSFSDILADVTSHHAYMDEYGGDLTGWDNPPLILES
jgi:hypothetical protein